MSEYPLTTDAVREKFTENPYGESESPERFDAWLAAELAKKEAEVRADEREKAAQRVREAIIAKYPNVADTHPVYELVAAARGEGAQ